MIRDSIPRCPVCGLLMGRPFGKEGWHCGRCERGEPLPTAPVFVADQLRAEVERLQAELAAARQDVADLREAFGWVLSVANWPEWYYSPSVPEVVRRLTNIDEIRGDRLDLRLLPEAEREVSGE